VTNNKNPNQKQPGEKEEGTFHYNPGTCRERPSVARKMLTDSKPTPTRNNRDMIVKSDDYLTSMAGY